jgi:hypothetical protein
MFTIIRLSLLTVFSRLLLPGGEKSIAAEKTMLRQQLIADRPHTKLAPKLSPADCTIPIVDGNANSSF